MNATPRLVAIWPWLFLVTATLISWLMAENAAAPAWLATGIVFLIAAYKIRLIVIHFMEVPWRARPQRLLLELWIAAVTIIVVGGYAATML